jgi:hypothetical protein
MHLLQKDHIDVNWKAAFLPALFLIHLSRKTHCPRLVDMPLNIPLQKLHIT